MFNLSGFKGFDPKTMQWSRFRQRLEHYIIANKVKKEVECSTVLTLIGDYAFNILCDILEPNQPGTQSLHTIFTILDKHFQPKPLSRAERFKFSRRVQGSEESISDYVAMLRKLSVSCDFKGDLERNIADQFVFGINNAVLRERLLVEEDDTTLDKLIHIASVRELSAASAKMMTLSPLGSDHNQEISSVSIRNKVENTSSSKESVIAQVDKLYKSCQHCGSNKHVGSVCKYRDASCFYCKRKGHITPVCRTKAREVHSNSSTFKNSDKMGKSVRQVEEEEDSSSDAFFLNSVTLNRLYASSPSPIFVDVYINGTKIALEMDTGAAVTILPVHLYSKFLSHIPLNATSTILHTINGKILPIGKAIVDVRFVDRVFKKAVLFVIKEGTVGLLGRTWISALKMLKFPDIAAVSDSGNGEADLKKLLFNYKSLFSDTLGLIQGYSAKVHLKAGAIPKFCKARPVPYALLQPISKELNKLCQQGIISPVKFSDWAAPIVPIVKKNGTLRICGDYKAGLNPVLAMDSYPLPVIEDIFTKLSGGTIFSKLDLTQAYQQVKMDESSTDCLTINTHMGLFKVNRLPFGIATAPSIFQCIMDQVLAGLPFVVCYLDDILVTGSNLESHLRNLDAVFSRLSKAGINLNRNKCEFLKAKVEYLGHVIDATGIRASPSKVTAIMEASTPKDVNQLRAFLGLINYYRKFLPDLATILAPLNILLGKGKHWFWSKEADEAFSQAKNLLVSPSVLTHYNPQFELSLACDASPYGVGAVLSHVFPDGSDRPIAFASRSLSSAERNYSQLDREALGIIFGVTKFNKFLFGRRFTLFTDHKPLTRLLAADKEVPLQAAARLQRWSLIMSSYSYDIRFRSSSQNSNADALSRCPLPSSDVSLEECARDFNLLNSIEDFPLTNEEIGQETLKDVELKSLMTTIRQGWSVNKCPEKFFNYFSKREELCVIGDCVYWGKRILVPSSLRKLVLSELHRHHSGVVKMKMIARSFFWWPGLDKDIEGISQSCENCVSQLNNPAKAPLHPWLAPENSWERIHIDFAGPYHGYYFLVCVDACSKWPEVSIVKSASTLSSIIFLDDLFCRYGYPLHIVSDNGAQFTSGDFQDFCRARGIHHTFSAPYHPSSNGLAERFIQTLKRFLGHLGVVNNLKQMVSEFLFAYRVTPHSLTKLTPAEIFLGRTIRSRLNLLLPKPDYFSKIAEFNTNLSCKRSFSVGERVLSKNFATNAKIKWIPGTITKVLGPLTYRVRFPGGKEGKRHLDQLLPDRCTKISEGLLVDTSQDLDPSSPGNASSEETVQGKRISRPPAYYGF